MDRRFISIHGSERGDGETRIALVLDADGQPEYLHAAGASGGGRFARVIRGFLGGGKLPKPVAVKIEHDHLPPGIGAAKFASEYRAQHDVHRDLTDGERTHVVRMFEMWKFDEGKPCDDIPPILICPVSRRILPPRCTCGEVLRDDRRCPRLCPALEADEILAASACDHCHSVGEPCRAYWLTRRTCKMLVLEQLDMDLGVYVRRRWHEATPADRAAWTRIMKGHMAALQKRIGQQGSARGRLMNEFAELEFLLAIYHDALCGVEELHDRDIPHLDLKPANYCLMLEGASARLKVIDLGQADSPNLDRTVRQRSLNHDVIHGFRDPVYSAPEQLPDRIREVDCPWWATSQGFQLDVTDDPGLDVLPGDWCYFAPHGGETVFHRIVGQSEVEGRRRVTAWRIDPNDPWPARVPDEHEPSAWQPAVRVAFVQSTGKSADVFALGMVLLFLLTRGLDLSPIRRDLPLLAGEFAELAGARPGRNRPARRLGGALLDRPLDSLAPFAAQLRDTPSALREVVKELFGIAFQAILRGVPGASYTVHRNDCPPAALKRLRGDVDAVRRRLRVLVRGHELHHGWIAEQRRIGISRLRAWLEGRGGIADHPPPPRYCRERLCETFDFIGSQPDRSHREFEYLLDRYRRNADALGRDLDLFEKELEAKHVSVDTIHPVVEKFLRLLSREFDQGEFTPPPPSVLEARKRLSKVDASLAQPLNDILRALDDVDPRTGAIPWTDRDADAFQFIADGLKATYDQLRRDVRLTIDCLRQLHDQQEKPVDEWLRLNAASFWQRFGLDLRARLQDRKAATDRWFKASKATGRMLRALVDDQDRVFNRPWSDVRRAHRRSLKGLFRRIVAWLRRKPFETPLPVARGDGERIRALVHHLRRGVARIRTVPSVRPVGEALVAGASRPRAAVSPRAPKNL